ncbi:MAG: DegT/DnrJ/EryC1/StrS family aminotransferase [Candidatus Aenigmarchaeota archaeon]|nr:DegT/DnrJ/EryC1/StrS family aminotransferase [Candidatus Aenigmarchaeota archaeon]
MKIPFVDLNAQYQNIKPEIDAAIQSVLDNTSFILGATVNSFEQAFAKFCGTKHVIGVNSGTDALTLVLNAMGIGAGDEVITVPNTFIATTEAITRNGAIPVFVDIDPKTFNIDVNKIEAAITPKTKAILPVHLYGQMADMQKIAEIAKKHNLRVLEDACQAHGAKDNGFSPGTLSDAACYSFYPGKNLGAYGDAGCVATNSDELAHKIKMLRNHGRTEKYVHTKEGFNSRMDALQATILTEKLKHLDAWIEKRRKNAKFYDEILMENVEIPFEETGKKHAYHLYVIRTKKREILQRALKENNISHGIHYPIPLHLQPAYEYMNHKKGDFPQTEKAAEEILSLPIYPELEKEKIEYVCEKINSAQNIKQNN